MITLVLALLGGCGDRALELALRIDTSCTVSIPAGGSLTYELVSEHEGEAPTVCARCIPVDAAVSGSEALLALLRTAAPTCTVARDTTLHARVAGYNTPACMGTTSSQAMCATSAPTPVGDGRSDQRIDVDLRCDGACVPMGCVAQSCADQAKNCGPVLDGCGHTLDCGTCKPPERCGGGGIDGVCGK